SYADNLTVVGGSVYFTADNGSTGIELWKTDGTTNGTALVKDINPGGTGSVPRSLTGLGNNVYFFANDGTHGLELWTSDGTGNGTTLVKDINPGATGSTTDDYTTFRPLVIGSTLYFAANDGSHGRELMKTDGTTGGTALVKDVRTTGGDSSAAEFVQVGN